MRRTYRRRRRAPVIAVVSVLAVLAAATWSTVLANASGPAGAQTCPPTAAGPPPGRSVGPDALAAVDPLPPAAVRLRVLNAGGQRGQANLVAAQFGDLGFGTAAPPDNDPYHPDGDMECVGQVRYGPAGEGAASLVRLVLPCAELVRDERGDDSVDVAVGTAFGDVNPGRPARDLLDALGGTSSGTTNPSAQPDAVAPLDPAVLRAARDADC